MALPAGTRLGSYAIVAKLGDGGMGEVYHGIDTRLGREVVSKVLATTTASSPDAQARFEREGRAIASASAAPNSAAVANRSAGNFSSARLTA
jgi:serine/threonine protein kinase